jgi:hypothetical protein
MNKKTEQDIIAEAIETFVEDVAWGNDEEYGRDIEHPTHDDIRVFRRSRIPGAPVDYGSTKRYRSILKNAQGDPSKTTQAEIAHVSPTGERKILGRVVKTPRLDDEGIPTGQHHISVLAPSSNKPGKLESIANYVSDEHEAINKLKAHHNLPQVSKKVNKNDLD